MKDWTNSSDGSPARISCMDEGSWEFSCIIGSPGNCSGLDVCHPFFVCLFFSWLVSPVFTSRIELLFSRMARGAIRQCISPCKQAVHGPSVFSNQKSVVASVTKTNYSDFLQTCPTSDCFNNQRDRSRSMQICGGSRILYCLTQGTYSLTALWKMSLYSSIHPVEEHEMTRWKMPLCLWTNVHFPSYMRQGKRPIHPEATVSRNDAWSFQYNSKWITGERRE